MNFTQDGLTDISIDHTEIVGPGSSTTQEYDTEGITFAYNDNVSLTYDNIHGVGHGIHFNGTSGNGTYTIENNYIWGLAAGPDAHFEDIYYGGNQEGDGNPTILIQHNTLLNTLVQTAAIFMSTDNGPIGGVTINDNLMGDPTQTLQYDFYAYGNQGSGNQPVSFVLSNNAMYAGSVNYSAMEEGTGSFTCNWYGNYDAVSLASISSQCQ